MTTYIRVINKYSDRPLKGMYVRTQVLDKRGNEEAADIYSKVESLIN